MRGSDRVRLPNTKLVALVHRRRVPLIKIALRYQKLRKTAKVIKKGLQIGDQENIVPTTVVKLA